MREFFIVAIMGAVLLTSIPAMADLGPSSEELTADIKLVQERINSVEKEISKYSKGLILSVLKIRQEILKNTRAMLQQKKLSLLRLIKLDYRIDGKSFKGLSNSDMAAVENDVKRIESAIEQQKAEASRYSGGLILMMKLSAIETERVTLSTLRMRYLTAKHGIPIFGPPTTKGQKEKTGALGKIVKDKDAL
jgi:hypothetical protein